MGSLAPMRNLIILILATFFLGCDSSSLKQTESLVYFSARDGNSDLYAIDVLGQWERRLTTNASRDWFPKWNQGTDKLIFYTMDESENVLAVAMSMEKTQVETLRSGHLSNFQLIPSGKRIIYSELKNGFQNIWWCNLDGTDNVQLTNSFSYNGYFSISPKGKRLLFISDRTGQNELYLLNLETQELKRLTDNDLIEQYNTWSQDGNRVAYTMRPSEEGSAEDIYILDLRSNNVTQLTNTPYGEKEIAWSISGDKIAFRGSTGDGDHIYTIDIKDGKFTKITSGDAYHGEPTWVPAEY